MKTRMNKLFRSGRKEGVLVNEIQVFVTLYETAILYFFPKHVFFSLLSSVLYQGNTENIFFPLHNVGHVLCCTLIPLILSNYIPGPLHVVFMLYL